MLTAGAQAPAQRAETSSRVNVSDGQRPAHLRAC